MTSARGRLGASHDRSPSRTTQRGFTDPDDAPLPDRYSAHGGARRLRWTTASTPARPVAVIYVARRSHANYFRAGTYDARECPYKGAPLHVCGNAPDRADGKGLRLTRDDYILAPLLGRAFIGSYGPANYVGGARYAPVQTASPTLASARIG